MDGECGRRQLALDAEPRIALCLAAAHHEEGAAMPGLCTGRGGGFCILQVGRGESQEMAAAFYCGLAVDGGIGTDVALGIHDFDSDEGQVLTVGGNDGAIGSQS